MPTFVSSDFNFSDILTVKCCGRILTINYYYYYCKVLSQ